MPVRNCNNAAAGKGADMAVQSKILYSNSMIVSHTKLLVLFVLFIGAGAAFTVTGVYMLSKKYLASLGDKKRLG